MKKKPLLFALLALAIVTSLTAGTLAVYTKSVELGTEVAVKKFAFTAAGGSDNVSKSISLAPGESDSYSFTVSNQDGDTISEVDLNCNIYINIAEAVSRMTGLTVTLSGDGITAPLKVDETGILNYPVVFTKSTATTNKYVVTLDWNGGEDTDHTDDGENGGVTEGLYIKVSATQA